MLLTCFLSIFTAFVLGHNQELPRQNEGTAMQLNNTWIVYTDGYHIVKHEVIIRKHFLHHYIAVDEHDDQAKVNAIPSTHHADDQCGGQVHQELITVLHQEYTAPISSSVQTVVIVRSTPIVSKLAKVRNQNFWFLLAQPNTQLMQAWSLQVHQATEQFPIGPETGYCVRQHSQKENQAAHLLTHRHVYHPCQQQLSILQQGHGFSPSC